MSTEVRCERLFKSYVSAGQEVMALQGLDLQVDAGELVGIIGPSGCGKTTLLHLLSGDLSPSAGRVLVEGTDISGMSRRELTTYRQQTVGLVWQDPSAAVHPHLSVAENVAVPAQVAGRRVRRHEVTRLLETVGLRDHVGARMSELSGGQMQRVAIAAALVNSPSLLLLDEPTSALDRGTSDGIWTLLRQIQAEQDTTVIVVSHDPALAPAVDRVIEIRDGQAGRELRSGTTSHAVAGESETLLIDASGRVLLPEAWRQRLQVTDRIHATVDDASITLSSPWAAGLWAPGPMSTDPQEDHDER